MPRTVPIALLLAAMLAAPAWPGTADAQVRHCTTAGGHSLYTDRRCEDLGATPRLPRDQAGAGPRLSYRGGCARQLQDLVFEVGSAIDAGDANRLAGVYHWPGLSSRSGYAVMARLDAIVRRPLVDIRPLRPAVPALPAAETDADAGTATALDGDYYPQVATRRPPVALRIEQTLTDGATPSRTTFGLRRHMDCWWITL